MKGGDSKGVPYHKIWNYTHVLIPPKSINLSAKSFDDSYETDITRLLETEFGDNSIRQKKGLDFIIVHLGILEKILTAQPGKSKDNPEDMAALIKALKEAVKSDIETKVILTSGRAPSELPENISFISYSLLSQYLIEKRFKPLLSEIIYASRPKKLEHE